MRSTVKSRKFINYFFKYFGVLVFFTTFSVAKAEHEPAHEATSEHHDKAHDKFKPGEMIFDHIKDNHDWHLWDYNGHPVSISLPVIIYSPGKGLENFSSSHFEHGHASYMGYKLVNKKIVAEDGHKFYDISITKNVASMLLGVLLLLVAALYAAKRYKKNSGKLYGVQSFLEPVILFIRDDVAKPSIGEKRYARYMPFLLTVFFFILINNLMGLIPIFPFGANVTGNIAVTMVLAVLTFIITTFSTNAAYWKHIFMPPVPIAMYIIIVPIEILGVFLKPLVLMIRLFANITAGHIIILGFFSLIFIFGEMSKPLGYGVTVLSVAFNLAMNCLELLVAFLQAYVFTLLASMYFGQAGEEHHHEEAHH
ncbi:MAG: F0F1 ATP synthase subunit A [Bacteroidota bacterium]|nr:F0F1 ATP synthase subunit A [Bacteroidota bacterium]